VPFDESGAGTVDHAEGAASPRTAPRSRRAMR
jgi:hypothetical protein